MFPIKLHVSHVRYTRVLKTLLEERGSCDGNIIDEEGSDKP